VSNCNLKVINRDPIVLTDGFNIEIDAIKTAIDNVNEKFRILKLKTVSMSLNIFEIIDFRMVSGLIGEALAVEFCKVSKHFIKNPNIDGYPDLLNISKPEYLAKVEEWKRNDLRQFIKYPYSGIEIKNTFGTKKANTVILPGQSRLGKINKKLEWKAHHVYTNNLLAIFSDYVEGVPQIIAAMYSDNLLESDWSEKQNPKEGSAMTSFSVIEKTGWAKLKAGIKICRDDSAYLLFLGQDFTE